MNIAYQIQEASKKFPSKKAVIFSQRNKSSYQYPYLTFLEFEERSNQLANRFIKLGITPGMRTLLFVKPCLDFSVITFALFKVGAIPVLIDPGMGLKNLLESIKQVKPEGLVSIGMVHWMRRIKRESFKSVKIKISLESVGGRTHHLYENLEQESKQFIPFEASLSTPAAILFTSGGTGIPKGVIYTHGILNAQTNALKEMFSLDEKQTDLPGFPLFALFTLAMGMSSVIPDMDPTKPSQCDPKKIVQNILDNQCSFVAGSPAIWERVGKYCLENKIQLGSVKYVVMFGAPVRLEIHQMFKKILIFGDTYTPYGATECLPVSLISGTEILNSHGRKMRAGAGTCIGKAVPETKIKIIKVTDIPETKLDEVPPGEIGEIVVQGPQVTLAYFDMEAETQKAKILDNNLLWHRMGDLGYIDHEQNLWFMGRKSHRVETTQGIFYPMQIEAIFNQHPEVKRSALVSLNVNGQVAPGLVIERNDGQTKFSSSFHQELVKLSEMTEKTKLVKHYFLHPHFPVDVRHNIKIDRVKLSLWAQKQVECQNSWIRKLQKLFT
ncbi:MAG: fatty acid CoA ligase family protein [Bacteriovoracaceae bacterium]